ncbi:hypothetical protein [Muriicola sp. Z0-33]|uniref:hypothetical protein n=1 Tax=Muriicola sp. Z0-33 TaxID=2816957 RepID=UPI002238C5A8|nr:hypothetical protein [Muriicola sp. Z0-33]MCW5515490.1 hypothetical protein [Muriicola sp. Z0-33]
MEVINSERSPKTTVTGSYGYAWQQLWKYFLYFFLVALIVGLLESPASIARESEIDNTLSNIFLKLLSGAYLLLVFPVINYGGDLLNLKGIRNEPMDMYLLFEGFKKNYMNIVLASLLTFAIIGIGLVFFIIPGIIFACRLAFVSYLVMDKNLEPIAAIEKSWEMTRDHGWQIFGIALLAIPLFLGGLLCFIVGAFIAILWVKATFAAFYHAVDLEEQKKMEF